MGRVITYSLIFLIVFSACKKDKVSNLAQDTLQGEWKLVTVKDKGTGSTFFRPASSSGDVIIKFSGNNFSGHTLRNTFSDGSYTLPTQKDILVGSFSMTKIAEEEWGGMFLTVLHACSLQSLAPCAPSRISFDGNKLLIESPMRYDVTLMRI